jgi:alkylation response protein AidB-like acyl-CoA dehydrogenase
MADFGATELDAFAAEVRKELAAMYPPELRDPKARTDPEAVWGGRAFEGSDDPQIVWMSRMAAKGWTTPTWPKEYGGAGLTAAQARVIDKELAAGKYRSPLASFGIWMLGPVLLEYANEAQKKRFLGEIVRGEIRWCQGYSEPGAGSDLAGLQMKCEDMGDHWLVNGQKIWTSYANKADWIFALVRTDTSKKHEGISFLLIDMKTPGVDPRPLTIISGQSPFCETFFTDVRVPKENLVGRLNGGWDIAKRLLQYERQNISGSMVSAGGAGGGMGLAAGALEEVAREFVGVGSDGRLADADLRARITLNKMGSHCFQLTQRRLAEEAKSGGPSAATSIIKYAGAELGKERNELLVEAMGLQGLGWEGGEGFSDRELNQTRAWLRSKGNSIEGGTSEINLNVVAKRVLGLLDHQ